MTKHIIIAGPPRAGKSTIAKLLVQTYPYQHISMDSIIAGLERIFPETGIDSDAEDDAERNVRYISKRIAQFIQAMIDSGEYDECPYGMSPAERLEILNANDTPDDYSYGESDEKKQRRCGEIVALSRTMKKQCEQYGLPYYETARSRETVIQAFLDRFERQRQL